MKNKFPSIKILGTNITDASEEEVLEYIFERLEKPSEKFYIVTPNPEILMKASQSKRFQDILNSAELRLADGVGVILAGRILKNRIIGRITGTDLMEKICAKASKRPITIGFLGGKDGVAVKTSECLREKYPGLRVVFASDEWPDEKKINNKGSMLKKEKGFKESTIPHIDILFVAFGAPKQEEWIAANLPKIDVTMAMGVGGAFDYLSGKVRRAPRWIRNAGFEWAFRLARQPWRIKRQLALPKFAFAILKERFS